MPTLSSQGNTELKVSFFGSAGTGKSHIIQKIQNPEKTPDRGYEPTLGTRVSKFLPADSLPINLWECPGQERLEHFAMPLATDKSDICIVCFDSTNSDSLKKAEHYIINIQKQLGKSAEILLVDTQEDKPAASQVSVKGNALKEKYGIKKNPISMGAFTEEGISKLRTAIITAGQSIPWKVHKSTAEKATDNKGPRKPDVTFINAFKSAYIAYLQSHAYPQNEVRKATPENQGPLTRIFDKLDLPIAPKQQFEENLGKTGSIMAYMRPTLNAAANILLNEDKSRLNDNVIEAIGKENYAQLVSGRVVDGIISAYPEQEADFARKEAEVARTVMSSVLVNYSQSLQDYNLSSVEKACKEKSDELYVQIGRLKKAMNDLPPTAEKSVIKIESAEDLQKKLDAGIQSIEQALKDGNADLPTVLRNAQDLKEVASLFLTSRLDIFSSNVLLPLSIMGTHFSMDMLNKPNVDKLSLSEVTDHIKVLVGMAERTTTQLNLMTGQEPAIRAITNLNTQLTRALETPDTCFPSASENTKKDYMLSAYKTAVKNFVNTAHDSLLTVEPAAPIMNVFSRFWRALCNYCKSSFKDDFKILTKEESDDQHRFSKEAQLKVELQQLRAEGKGLEPPDPSSFNPSSSH